MADVFISFVGGIKKKLTGDYTPNWALQICAICLSALLLLIIAPIFYLQLTNRINSTTTSIRFSRRTFAEFQEAN